MKKTSWKRRLVLDIGASAIRLCELTKTKTGYQLSKYYHRDLIVDPASDEETKRSLRCEALRALLKEAKVRSKKVVMAVPGQSVFTRPRPLPPVPEYKVAQIVKYEIQQQIPFSLSQIALDYHVIDRTEAGGYYVLMAAIKVDIVERCLAILQEAKLSVDVVDVSPLAAYNWLKYTGEFGDQGECIALVDLGATTTDIVIERENQFRWNRPLSLGGNDITKALAEEFGVSFEEAERLKRARGFAPTGDPQRDGKGGEVIGRVLSRLVSEISRSFAYYRSQPGGGPVSRVILTGGGACLRNIVAYLQRQLGVEVRIAQPLAGLAIGPGAQQVNEHPEQAAVVLGLALRCCEPVPIEINLIPPRVLEGERRKRQIVYWAFSFAIVLLIIASIVPDRANRYKATVENTETLVRILCQYDPRLLPKIEAGPIGGIRSDYERELNELTGRVGGYKSVVEAIDRAQTERVNWLYYLNVINEARPKEEGKALWISSLESTTIGVPTGGPGAFQPAAAAQWDRDAERRGEGLRAAISLPGGMAQIGSPAALPGGAVQLPSTGFPGLGMGYSATMAATVAQTVAPEDEEDMEMGIATGAPQYYQQPGAGHSPGQAGPPKPNGLIIQGYAIDPDTVLVFKQRLIDSGAFIPGGVYLNEATVNPVDVTALDGAETGLGRMGTPSTPYSASYQESTPPPDYEEDSRERRAWERAARRGAMAPYSYSPSPTPSFAPGAPVFSTGGTKVISFRVDVQFAGEKFEMPSGAFGRTR